MHLYAVWNGSGCVYHYRAGARIGEAFVSGRWRSDKGLKGSTFQRPIRQRTDPPWRTLNAERPIIGRVPAEGWNPQGLAIVVMPSEVEASLDFSSQHTCDLTRANIERPTPNIQHRIMKSAGRGDRTHTILRSLD